MPEYIYLEDLTGPYAGKVRPYLKHAAENAITGGFARRPGPKPVTDEPQEPNGADDERGGEEGAGGEEGPTAAGEAGEGGPESDPEGGAEGEGDDGSSDASEDGEEEEGDDVDEGGEGETGDDGDDGEGDAPRPLPEDFPGRGALIAAGLDTVEAVAAIDDLTKVPDVGPSTAKRIVAALEELEA